MEDRGDLMEILQETRGKRPLGGRGEGESKRGRGGSGQGVKTEGEGTPFSYNA